MDFIEIKNRYNELSKNDCCLSCGETINFSNVADGEICVDLGCGRGTEVLKLSEKVGNNGFIYGIDISEGMIETAKRNAKKFNITNVDFIKCELENINLPEKTADLVISNCTINHSLNKQKVWNEIHRILKPNGRFVISDIYSTEIVPEIYKNDLHAVAECWAGAVTKAEYITTIKNAGFTNFEIIEESKPYTKGKIEVCSFTIKGTKTKCNCKK